MMRWRVSGLVVPAAVVAGIIAVLMLARHAAESPSSGLAAARLAAGSSGGAALLSAGPRAERAPAPEETSDNRESALDAMFATQRLVRTATLTLSVSAASETSRRVASIIAAHEGIVADSRSAREAGDRESATLIVRVPDERFEEAWRELRALGRIEASRVETRDVTREYIDLVARLSAKRDAERRLQEILMRRTAGLSDLIAAEQERARLIEEIERLEGERRYQQRQVSDATITVELREPEPFVREGAVRPLREALRGALPLLSASAAALVYAIAAALPWALVALAIWSLRRRSATRRLIHIATRE
jgi:Domain of unknown function (DUF4349)